MSDFSHDPSRPISKIAAQYNNRDLRAILFSKIEYCLDYLKISNHRGTFVCSYLTRDKACLGIRNLCVTRNIFLPHPTNPHLKTNTKGDTKGHKKSKIKIKLSINQCFLRLNKDEYKTLALENFIIKTILETVIIDSIYVMIKLMT